MWLFRSGLVLLVYVLINIYTGVRFFGLLKYLLPSTRALIFWPLYLLFCFSYILTFLLRFDRIRPLRQAAMYTLPAIVYFFIALLFMDALHLILLLSKVIPASRGFSAAVTGIALAFAVLLLFYGIFHARDIRTVHYNVTVNKEMAGIRVALVSDLHIGKTVGHEWTRNIVNAVNETKPDIIFLAGDIFDNDINSIADPEAVAEELRRLKAPLGIYACQGNHDVDRFSLRENAATLRIQDFLKNSNILLLLDEVELVPDRFYLAGRRDARPIGSREARMSAAELADGLDKSKPLFFLDHQPVDFPAEEEAGADLIFSGHTHKGQFFPGNLATARIFKKAGAVHYGYWQGRTAKGIVSSGAGVWGPAIRVATDSEVAVIDIKSGN